MKTQINIEGTDYFFDNFQDYLDFLAKYNRINKVDPDILVTFSLKTYYKIMERISILEEKIVNLEDRVRFH